MKEFFSAPTSFLTLACLRQAVRLAWRAAASDDGASGADGGAAVAGTALGEPDVGTFPDGPAAASPNGMTQTLKAIAGRERRIWNSTWRGQTALASNP